MNQAAEAKHKEGVLAWVRCGCGGVQGRVSAVPSSTTAAATDINAPSTPQRSVMDDGGLRVPPLTPKGTPCKQGRMVHGIAVEDL
eukprot:3717889-Rhodomonas_salina.1